MCDCGREPRAVVVEGKGHKVKRARMERKAAGELSEVKLWKR